MHQGQSIDFVTDGTLIFFSARFLPGKVRGKPFAWYKLLVLLRLRMSAPGPVETSNGLGWVPFPSEPFLMADKM